MATDQLYRQSQTPITPFCFDQKVAAVFDDMIARSVPIYRIVHEILPEVLQSTFQPEKRIYDLGCSTGTTLALLAEYLKQHHLSAPLIGVDNSSAMLAKAQEKLPSHITLLEADIIKANLEPAGMVIMNYTLQFIPIEARVALLTKIHHCLSPNGVLILAEKLTSPHQKIHDFLDELYVNYKRQNGYSTLEISQKREALENVLQPMSLDTHLTLLKDAGFIEPELIVRWYNFGCFMALAR